MPNNQIDPSLSLALQQGFNKPQDQQQSPGLWQALVNAINKPSQPSPAPVDPYQNFGNKAAGLPYK